MNTKITIVTMLLLSIFITSSCEQKTKKDGVQAINNNLLMATLYNYYASEYSALSHQAFNIATERLIDIRRENPARPDLAVIIDIDETILDNSPFEAKMILADSEFNSGSWTHWCKLAAAEPVPGALEFLQLADSMGFNVFYISNRSKEKVQDSTIINLQKLGFPQLNADHFLLKEKTSNKESRRQVVLKNYEIVLLAGDNLGDFYEDSSDHAVRDSLMLANKENFGNKFIVLPNAMYGEWVASIGLRGNKKAADSLLKVMIKSYHD